MSINHLLIVTSEPNSVFLELLFKYFKFNKKKIKKKITLIGNFEIIKNEAKKNKFKLEINQILNLDEAKSNQLNLIDIKIKSSEKKKTSLYILKSFKKSLSLLKDKKDVVLFNGPIEKKTFLKKKYLGMTEYLASKTNSRNPVMLIYNNNLAVSPITTHLPIKNVSKNLNKINIVKKVKSIHNFYKRYFNKKPKFAVLGLNPHCETVEKIGEEQKIIIPAINVIKKSKIFVKGPFSADTFFIEKNINKYDVVIGMYHDQVLAPLKTLFNFNAINITIGLPFIRVSPDHGPNSEMYGKNKSDPASIYCAMKFFNKI
tara:strand:- start:294 stop:1238 length:945 start_codon:yes stop_codon:yes gene_type:complete